MILKLFHLEQVSFHLERLCTEIHIHLFESKCLSEKNTATVVVSYRGKFVLSDPFKLAIVDLVNQHSTHFHSIFSLNCASKYTMWLCAIFYKISITSFNVSLTGFGWNSPCSILGPGTQNCNISVASSGLGCQIVTSL